jgi:integrase
MHASGAISRGARRAADALPLDKAGTGRSVALNSVAREALLSIKRDRTILAAWVFPSPEGKRFVNLERYWRPALAVAQIPDFRFHDLRHTFASRLTMAGVDLYTIQRAGGCKSQIMVQRYAHLSPDHMRAAVERLAPLEKASEQEIRDQNRDWKNAGLGVMPAQSLTGHGDPGGFRTS